ncbi:hypothetical protein CGCS363_v006853 [Colletotrichum siamense]|uniref:uncharacterized protein n=1 Tax=Colletotrichum siamense TaxID=690259 RepID=UPI00187327C5|nr:uncharacterized protein CGCS363_v006853 [Colletotrichum siamense]KAF5501574.1 hypothetical protein CGCS363_v006853 [Colletotrichum siamense]
MEITLSTARLFRASDPHKAHLDPSLGAEDDSAELCEEESETDRTEQDSELLDLPHRSRSYMNDNDDDDRSFIN